MINRLMENKFVLISLGFLTAIFLFAVLLEGGSLSSPHSVLNTAGDFLAILYIAVPVLLFILGIVRFRMTKDRRFLIYTISVLSSSVIVIPLLFIAFIIVFVGLFGFMPTPS